MFHKIILIATLFMPLYAAGQIAYYQNEQYGLVSISFALGLVWAMLFSYFRKAMKDIEGG